MAFQVLSFSVDLSFFFPATINDRKEKKENKKKGRRGKEKEEGEARFSGGRKNPVAGRAGLVGQDDVLSVG